MKITISRIEIVVINSVKNVLETTEFTNWTDTFFYLEKQLRLELTNSQKQAFQDNPYTVTNSHKEMVSAGDSAYLADICYAVGVEK